MTLERMVDDLNEFMAKGYKNAEVTIYCKNCDCQDHYLGAIASGHPSGCPALLVIITINK